MGRTLESKNAVSAAWVKTQRADKKMSDRKIVFMVIWLFGF